MGPRPQFRRRPRARFSRPPSRRSREAGKRPRRRLHRKDPEGRRRRPRSHDRARHGRDPHDEERPALRHRCGPSGRRALRRRSGGFRRLGLRRALPDGRARRREGRDGLFRRRLLSLPRGRGPRVAAPRARLDRALRPRRPGVASTAQPAREAPRDVTRGESPFRQEPLPAPDQQCGKRAPQGDVRRHVRP